MCTLQTSVVEVQVWIWIYFEGDIFQVQVWAGMNGDGKRCDARWCDAGVQNVRKMETCAELLLRSSHPGLGQNF